jgi:P-type E1-E2 ATPase
MLAPRATVVRGGSRQGVDAALIVPGDVCFFQSGDRVPADCRLLTVANLHIQEAMLTGESMPVTKKLDPVPPEAALGDRKCLAYSGTLVMSGQGMGVVTASGDNAEIGKINQLVGGQVEPPTPILVQLELFGRFIAVVTIVLGVAAVSILTQCCSM